MEKPSFEEKLGFVVWIWHSRPSIWAICRLMERYLRITIFRVTVDSGVINW